MNHKILDRGTYALIETAILRDNYLQIQSHCSFTDFVCPMVKANAYGHGDVLVAKTLEDAGCSTLGVGFIEEAIPLREANVECEILVFGVFQEACVPALENMKLTPVISTFEQFDYLDEHVNGKMKVHLKFNTGMNRLGFEVSKVHDVKARVEKSSKFEVVGVCTHLQCGEDLGQEKGYSLNQLHSYESVLEVFPREDYIHHTFNSASLINVVKHDLVDRYNFGIRPGISLYGYPPVKTKMSLKPAMSLYSKLVNFHRIKKGEVVSYGATWKAERDSIVGVVPIGYADGYMRILSNQSLVIVGDQLCPLIGRVCMDYVMVDLTDLSFNPSFGDPVTLLGSSQSHAIDAESLAQKSQTISYEVLTSVGERVPRLFV